MFEMDYDQQTLSDMAKTTAKEVGTLIGWCIRVSASRTELVVKFHPYPPDHWAYPRGYRPPELKEVSVVL